MTSQPTPQHSSAQGASALPPARRLAAEEINRLPIAAYEGAIHVIRSADGVRAAVRALRGETLLGFDTETRPTFRKGDSYPPALLQLAGAQAVYVFQLGATGLPPDLAAILADPRILKAGVAIGRDVRELQTMADFRPAGFVDLGDCARRLGMPHHGLRGLAAHLLGCRISKGARLTNWARPDLPPRTIRYAATDAWIGRRLYEAMRARGWLRAVGPEGPPLST